eukprot:TRINITY_DN6206_c0_g1_i2.p2 TRINITY_DN6206_c0_g1~~TRINITY_DN6206_c0_g1_i2.p2  ORF type:complete len:161 (-),score=35.60 TRINITY_DN6206_c0_g1_i2:66-548(-)
MENVEAVETVENGGLLGWVKSLVRSKRQAKAPLKKLPPKAKVAPKNAPVKTLLKRPGGPVGGSRSLGGPLKNKVPPKNTLQKKLLPKRPLARSVKGAQQKKKKIKKKKVIKNKAAPGRKIPAKSAGLARTISLEIYNKLWCFDLAVGKALKKCVEDKLKT